MPTHNFINRIQTKLRAAFIFCLTGFPVYLLVGAFATPPDSMGAVASDSTAVKVTSDRANGVTRFFVQNLERSEVTMTFDFSLQNLKSNVQFPYTATFKPGQSEAFELAPMNSDEQWQYSFTNYYKLGSSVAEPDSYVYALPYTPGRTYRVTQGYDGKFSHQGSNKYAIDWKMPEGTPVFAARDGLVVKIKDDSNRGGASMKFDPYNNYVLIRHADGTLGHYCHLQKGGVKVSPGDYVKAGQPIALSGNTGFSSGAHLHFCVFMTKDGRERVSIPVKFRAASGEPVTLVEGQSYPAGEVRNAKTLATTTRNAGGSMVQ